MSADTGGLDACSLATKAEVEAAIGASVLDPHEQDIAPIFECTYNDPKTPVFPLASVSVIASGTADQAKGIYDELYEGAADNEAISGLGEAAYWSKTFDLEVLVGRYVVAVYVDHLVADWENVEKGLATKVLARLP